ncbi:hypothetical protein U9M48_042410 [Paspalum notatum var. saurae]|uniref:Uncharacterized protein n=1 Tax=Paspalum notatum var. saurae TaxID=547442 RepID=A0AAQ3XHK3_PASNO
MEDMLRACALTYGTKREAGLPFASFRTTMDAKPKREEKVAKSSKAKEAQSRRRVMPMARRRELSFEEGDSVYLKVSPIRGTKRFRIKGKLAPRYIGPYKERSPISWSCRESMRDIHDVFHVSQLRKCTKVPDQQINLDCRRVTTRSSLSRETNQNFGYGRRKTRTTTTKICEFFGAVTAKRRQLGKRRCSRERTPPSVRKPTRSRGRDLF